MTRTRVALVLAVVTAASCSVRSRGPAGPLPPSPVQPSAYQPDRAFALQQDGVLNRDTYQTSDATPFRVRVLDLIVGPGKSAGIAYEGAVVVDVRGGAGRATVAERQTAIGPGGTFGVPQGEQARVENSGREPLLLRIYIVAIR